MISSTSDFDSWGLQDVPTLEIHLKSLTNVFHGMGLQIHINPDYAGSTWSDIQLMKQMGYENDLLVAHTHLFVGAKPVEGWAYSYRLGGNFLEQARGSRKLRLLQPRLHRFIYHDFKTDVDGYSKALFKRLCLTYFAILALSQPQPSVEQQQQLERSRKFFSWNR
ncbi:hypothetical protein [Siphonobacter curvatus]|uniref:hypothetical protein n=1 Tax=Siphonobacter curvatus TaxID=2094562 RepID=UPI0013FD8521|nr:hypothetical protein [Siphonobacter curvatus]